MKARILGTITQVLLQRRYGHAPAQDPTLEELLFQLPGNIEVAQRLTVMGDIDLMALGDVIMSPSSARGASEVEAEMLVHVEDAVERMERLNTASRPEGKRAKGRNQPRTLNSQTPLLRVDDEAEVNDAESNPK